MQKMKIPQIIFILGFCLCVDIFSPSFAVAASEATIGGNGYEGVIDETTIHDTVLTGVEILENYQDVVFIKNMVITDENDRSSTKCVLDGSFLGKINFDLTRNVDALKIGLNLPQCIAIRDINEVYKDGTELVLAEGDVSLINGNIIFINKNLVIGNYEINIVLKDSRLITVNTKFVSDTNNNISCEGTPLQVEIVELPDII